MAPVIKFRTTIPLALPSITTKSNISLRGNTLTFLSSLNILWCFKNKSEINNTIEMKTVITPDYQLMLNTAIQQAQKGLKEGGIPIGAALFSTNGTLLGKGRNRRIQNDDPSVHGETDAFRDAGRQLSYSNIIMVTTLAPCWYCSGLIRQFKIKTVIVGESVNFSGGVEWLKQNGVEIIDLNSDDCISMLANYIKDNSEIWNEDIGEE
jgi:cytosine deaminase